MLTSGHGTVTPHPWGTSLIIEAPSFPTLRMLWLNGTFQGLGLGYVPAVKVSVLGLLGYLPAVYIHNVLLRLRPHCTLDKPVGTS